MALGQSFVGAEWQPLGLSLGSAGIGISSALLSTCLGFRWIWLSGWSRSLSRTHPPANTTAAWVRVPQDIRRSQTWQDGAVPQEAVDWRAGGLRLSWRTQVKAERSSKRYGEKHTAREPRAQQAATTQPQGTDSDGHCQDHQAGPSLHLPTPIPALPCPCSALAPGQGEPVPWPAEQLRELCPRSHSPCLAQRI